MATSRARQAAVWRASLCVNHEHDDSPTAERIVAPEDEETALAVPEALPMVPGSI
jgi:hypothetical protein